jgi:hypothetical protein
LDSSEEFVMREGICYFYFILFFSSFCFLKGGAIKHYKYDLP